MRNAKGFKAVEYPEVWDGIDMRYYLQGESLKYDLYVLPGADPADIAFGFRAVDDLAIDEATGDLLIGTPLGPVRDKATYAYQDGPGGRTEVPVEYELTDGNTFRFDLGEYDNTRTLIIDPQIEYSTYVGGSADEYIHNKGCVYPDGKGHVYIAGPTKSANFPVKTGSYDTSYAGDYDIFAAKFNEDDQAFDYCTFLGGSSYDAPFEMIVNATGCMIIGGSTDGGGYPTTTGAHDTSYNGYRDVVITKLEPDGSDLVFSTFVGGTGRERVGAMDIDDEENIYVGGWDLQDRSGRFPTTAGAYQTSSRGNNEGFVFKLKADGSTVEWATYIGGSKWEHVLGLHVEDNGSVLIHGYTQSTNYPTTPGVWQDYQITIGTLAYDGVISRLSGHGSRLLTSTYYGGRGIEWTLGLEVDSNGDIIVAGMTESNDLPKRAGKFDSTYGGGRDGFILKMKGDMTAPVFSTYIGGTGLDRVEDIMVDNYDNIWFTLETFSSTIPTSSDAPQSNHAGGGNDGYIGRLDSNGDTLLFGSYWGGTSEDRGRSVWAQGGGAVWFGSLTKSTNFPTSNGCMDPTHNGGWDGGLTKLVWGKPPVWGPVPTLHAVEDVPYSYDFSYNVTDPDSPLSNLSISSSSPFVIGIIGMNVTFEFPEGVTRTNVTLSLSDGSFANIVVDVPFMIQPVNDAPAHTIPSTMTAIEDIPLLVNISRYLQDMDNPEEDLFLEPIDDPYVTDHGKQNFTVLFPEGVTEHTLSLVISDGLLNVSAEIQFNIQTVDDPPVIAAMDLFNATEDQVSVLDIEPYLSDVDTPIDGLTLDVRDPNVTVVGHELHFSYSVGDTDHTILVKVTDGRSWALGYLDVHVDPVNDPPIVHVVSPRGLTEDKPRTIDLSIYIEDEDTPLDQITLDCDHPSVVSIDGFNLTLLYTVWWDEHTVNFTVTDGFLETGGSFVVQIAAVNDPPVITTQDITVISEDDRPHLTLRHRDGRWHRGVVPGPR